MGRITAKRDADEGMDRREGETWRYRGHWWLNSLSKLLVQKSMRQRKRRWGRMAAVFWKARRRLIWHAIIQSNRTLSPSLK